MSHRKLLLIEDEDDIREVASLTLETLGEYEVVTAANGEDGIRKAVEERPDAILLDVMMPVLDGPSTFCRLQTEESTRDIPVIFITAKVQAAERRRLVELGARGIIAKPFDPLRLAEEIEEILSK